MSSDNERILETQLKARNRTLPRPAFQIAFKAQYKFHPDRKFRADFAVWNADRPARMSLLVEVDGAKRGAPGAHQRVDGIDYDCRRIAEALVIGHRVLRVSSRMVRDGTALNYIERLLK